MFFDFNLIATRYENYGGKISDRISEDALLLSDKTLPVFDPYGYKFQDESVNKLYTLFVYIRDKMNNLQITYFDEWIMTYRRWISNYSENSKARTAFKEYILFGNKLNDFSEGLTLDMISVIDKMTVYELEKNVMQKFKSSRGV